jgi:hypothetical protein
MALEIQCDKNFGFFSSDVESRYNVDEALNTLSKILSAKEMFFTSFVSAHLHVTDDYYKLPDSDDPNTPVYTSRYEHQLYNVIGQKMNHFYNVNEKLLQEKVKNLAEKNMSIELITKLQIYDFITKIHNFHQLLDEFIPKVDKLKSSTVDEPKSSKVDEPKSSKVDEPKSSKVDEPKSSKVDEPKSSKVDIRRSLKDNILRSLKDDVPKLFLTSDEMKQVNKFLKEIIINIYDFATACLTMKYSNMEDFCANVKFNKKGGTLPTTHRDEFETTEQIIEFDTIKDRQYVFGRMSNLQFYYKFPILFKTLASPFWDTDFFMNDMFTLCSINYLNSFTYEKNKFPIRIVTSKKSGLYENSSLDDFSYASIYPKSLLGTTKSFEHQTIFNRELCQLFNNNFDLYQSVRNKHIFYLTKIGEVHDPELFRKITIKIHEPEKNISLSNMVGGKYYRKYMKYKNKYTELKKMKSKNI